MRSRNGLVLLAVVLFASGCQSEDRQAKNDADVQQPAAMPAASDPASAAPASQAAPQADPGKPDKQRISIKVIEMPIREAALKAADLAGMRIENPDILPTDKQVTLTFQQVSLNSVMKILADESALAVARKADESFEFLRKDAPAKSRGTPVTLTVSNEPLRASAERLAKLGGVRIVNPEQLPGNANVTFAFKDTPVDTAVEAVVQEHDLSAIRRGDEILLTQ